MRALHTICNKEHFIELIICHFQLALPQPPIPNATLLHALDKLNTISFASYVSNYIATC